MCVCVFVCVCVWFRACKRSGGRDKSTFWGYILKRSDCIFNSREAIAAIIGDIMVFF